MPAELFKPWTRSMRSPAVADALRELVAAYPALLTRECEVAYRLLIELESG
jgi:hypothetical protein